MLALYRHQNDALAAGDLAAARAADPYLHTAAVLGQPDHRQLGKFLTLSAGFGISGRGLVAKAPGYDLVLLEAEADGYVQAWREANAEIVAFWYALFEVFKYVAESSVGCSLETFGLRISHEDAAHGSDLIRIVLPSGRSLIYHQPEFVLDDEYEWKLDLQYQQSGKGDWFSKKIWYGSLTENVVQAIAADLLIRHMLQIEAANIPLIGTIHDEVIALTKEQDADAALAKMLEIMQTPPAWCADLPLWAEGYVNSRYVKLEK
jgi:DNA polymerase